MLRSVARVCVWFNCLPPASAWPRHTISSIPVPTKIILHVVAWRSSMNSRTILVWDTEGNVKLCYFLLQSLYKQVQDESSLLNLSAGARPAPPMPSSSSLQAVSDPWGAGSSPAPQVTFSSLTSLRKTQSVSSIFCDIFMFVCLDWSVGSDRGSSSSDRPLGFSHANSVRAACSRPLPQHRSLGIPRSSNQRK